MAKRALLIGIDHYEHVDALNGCVADAVAMADVLGQNGDESVNFTCRLLASGGSKRVTRSVLRQEWLDLFHDFTGDILVYFSGHGVPTEVGGYLVTQEGTLDDPGLPMQHVVDMANGSSANSVLIILDCCFSGSAGNPASLQGRTPTERSLLREGVTILTASRPTQVSMEIGGHGVFTKLVLGALKGGAANVRGHVSAASMYAYVEAALGAFDQRPLYKSHAAHLEPVRTCKPTVPDSLLRELKTLFPTETSEYQLDPTYEETNKTARAEHVAIFKKFKRLQIGGLLRPKLGDDLYWTAERSGSVVLTDLGTFYRLLVKKGLV